MEWYVYQRGSSPIRKISGKRGFRFKRYLLIALCALAVAGLIWCITAFVKINSARTTEPMQKADAGIILGMAMWGEQPSPGLKERLDYGLKLFKEGKFSTIIVSGGLDKPGYKYTEAQGMRNYLVGQGVPEEAILLDNKSTSTYENLLFSQDIMQEKALSTAIIVTHSFHGRRALEIADELGYPDTQLGLTESDVMSMLKYKTREVLAYTKWKLQQLTL